MLSPKDFKHWQTYGFVVVKQAVPAENVHRLVKLLWEFQEMDPNDTSTWNAAQLRNHAMKELNNSGMVTPAPESNEELRQRRIESWRERRAPEGFAFPGDPREWERTKYATAELTPLGRRLLGLDLWSNKGRSRM